ncbi:conjugal transfer protein TraM [Legionella qingyii]|uniref:Conjugal transfer protein TraM n=1 Tax=Legionella qingyii TaxID=2184757 RepID=A0A317TY86_9GAMM|nr:conjugal transfer protein TraM [Legionella qingyii]PWY54584.1 conjugal transfer protein TraM [Legionella qingyii]
MSDKFNEVIQDIAVRHGVVLGKDDPILILQTMNVKLLEENRRVQEAMLAKFREEIESISSQWKDRVLFRSAMKNMISSSLAEARDITQQARTFSRYALLSSTVILIGSCLFIFISLEHILR